MEYHNTKRCSLPDVLENGSVITILNSSSLTAGDFSNIGTNTTIRVLNGTLDLSESSLSGIDSVIEVGASGKLFATATTLAGVNLTTNATLTAVDSNLAGFQSSASTVFVNTTWQSLNTTNEVDVRFYYEPDIRDQFGGLVANVSISNGTNNFLGDQLNLTGYVINKTETVFEAHNLTFFRDGYYNHSIQLSLTDNIAESIVLNKKPMPDTTGFLVLGLPSGLGNNYSTDLAALTNISGVSIKKAGVGRITYLVPVNLSFVNLTQVLSIQPNRVSLNSSLAPGLNRSANLSFQNLSFVTMPVIRRNGVVCDTCSKAVYENQILNVTVSAFSTYSLHNNSEISLTTPSVIFNGTPTNFSVIYHAYENSSERIAGAVCESCY